MHLICILSSDYDSMHLYLPYYPQKGRKSPVTGTAETVKCICMSHFSFIHTHQIGIKSMYPKLLRVLDCGYICWCLSVRTFIHIYVTHFTWFEILYLTEVQSMGFMLFKETLFVCRNFSEQH